jgi:hypothetical protein
MAVEMSPLDVLVITSTAVVTYLGIVATPIFFALRGKQQAEQKGENPLWAALLHGIYGYVLGLAFVAFFHVGVQVLNVNPEKATCVFFHGFNLDACPSYGNLYLE